MCYEPFLISNFERRRLAFLSFLISSWIATFNDGSWISSSKTFFNREYGLVVGRNNRSIVSPSSLREFVRPSLFILSNNFSSVKHMVLLKAFVNPFIGTWYGNDDLFIFDTSRNAYLEPCF